jgi:hypothetical protein
MMANPGSPCDEGLRRDSSGLEFDRLGKATTINHKWVTVGIGRSAEETRVE